MCVYASHQAEFGRRHLGSQGFQARVLLPLLSLFNLLIFSLIYLLWCHLNTKIERGFLPVRYHYESVFCRPFQEWTKDNTAHETKMLFLHQTEFRIQVSLYVAENFTSF